jgi:hypothetical protein
MCKTKIKKSFTKILTIILSVKIVLTLRVKLPCPKSKILIVREILVLSFINFCEKGYRSPIDFQGHRSKVKVTGSNF